MRGSDNETILKMTDYISLKDMGDKYNYRALNGNSFWKTDPIGYGKYISDFYQKIKGTELKISIQKFEEFVITAYFDLINNKDHSYSLKDEIEKISIESLHAILPIFNIQITADKVEIGEYCLVQFQKLGQYIESLKCVIPDLHKKDFVEDHYFDFVPFVDIVVEARDNKFALETAKNKLQSFISFLNYCLFSDIKGIDVASSFSDAGNRNRHYLVSSTSFSSSWSISDPRVARPNISDLVDYVTNEEGNNRLIEIVQKDTQDNELEKRIFNALNWLGLAIAEKNNAIALTQATFAVECLLQADIKGEPITKSIVASLGESIAFLAGNNYEERKNWEKRFKKTYGLRSKIAHGKGNDVTVEDVFEGITIAKRTIIAILTNSELKNAKTIQMVNNYIEKQRYTCMEDDR